MRKSIVICEKPSQARALRAAIGGRYGEILPACGHLLTLKEPEDMRDAWQDWSTELLWPDGFYGKKVITQTRKYFDAIRNALKDAEHVILATDCDREGQLIGDEILAYVGFRGTVKRAIFNAEDPKTLQDAFRNLKPNDAFKGLYASGCAREQADQTTNLSLTRTATVTLKAPGAKGAIGIGRVKTPVLGIICKRELEIENFKPEDLFEIDAQVSVKNGSLVLTCSELPKGMVKSEQEQEAEEDLDADDAALAAAEDTRNRIRRKDLAEALAAAVKGYQGPVSSHAERKKQAPPKLFDLTSLQSTASSRFGWSGEKTLSVAQKLYSEYTLITYPRGEAKYLPEANIADIPMLVGALTGLPHLDAHAGLVSPPVVRKGKSGHFSDKALEGLSHYAIIPNVNTVDQFARQVPRLPEDEARLFDLIARQYLAALAPDYEYRQTIVTMPFPWKGHDWTFRTIGRVPLVPGWRAIIGSVGRQEDPPDLPEIETGENALVRDASVRVVTTRPPARYTEGSLIRVMQEAWRLVEDPEHRARLKEAKGIGTPATRGDVVKGLLNQGQIKQVKKSLMPTEGGMLLYKTLMQVCPNVVDPGRTAIWEILFDLVEKGKMPAQDAVLRILKSTRIEMDRIIERGQAIKIEIGKSGKPTPKMLAAMQAIAKRKNITIPKGAQSNAATCRAFLKEHLPQREEGDGPRMPSDKQIAFAEKLALEADQTLPDEARQDAGKLSQWIDARVKAAPPRPPSEKQLAFATRLAQENGVEIPDKVRQEMASCSAFIDQFMKAQKSGSSRGKR